MQYKNTAAAERDALRIQEAGQLGCRARLCGEDVVVRPLPENAFEILPGSVMDMTREPLPLKSADMLKTGGAQIETKAVAMTAQYAVVTHDTLVHGLLVPNRLTLKGQVK